MIYITCPANTYTGGPTLAHQLCSILNSNGIPSTMYYDGFDDSKDSSPVHKNYIHFGNPYVTTIQDNYGDIFVVLETKTYILQKISKAKKYIWWMSVDNYFTGLFTPFEKIWKKLWKKDVDIKRVMEKKKKYIELLLKDVSVSHLTQSFYAKEFLLKHNVCEENVFMLTDYIEDEVLNVNIGEGERRNNVVLYNPKKGMKFTKKIINQMKEYDVTFIPLIGMSKEQIIRHLCSSKVYVDFGNHPGKDRFPREAAICGCCVITGVRGAAKNDYDVPIERKYKFEDNDDQIEHIVDRIIDVMDNYDDRIHDFEKYRSLISKEKLLFEKESLEIFEKYKNC